MLFGLLKDRPRKLKLKLNGCPCGTCQTYMKYSDCKKHIGCNACNPTGIGFNHSHEEYMAAQDRAMAAHPEMYKGVHLPEMLVDLAKKHSLRLKVTTIVV